MPAIPKLVALATAVPRVSLAQDEVAAAAQRFFDPAASEIGRLGPAFSNAGIARRHSPVALDWHEGRRGWKDRHAAFQPAALDLLEEAAADCLASAGVSAGEIDSLVVACTSGISVPSLDAHLLDRLPFRRNVERLPIFGLGCAGGVLGLARAAALAQAAPGRKVLFLIVELCTLTFRSQDQSKSNIIAAALFGDGAAAVLLEAEAESRNGDIAVDGWGEYTWPDSAEVMGWRVEDDGLGVLFSPEIPKLVCRDLPPVLDGFLDSRGLTRADLDGFLPHPGGEKIMAALERVLDLQSGSLRDAREVLRDYGNMSGVSVLFVLQRALARGLAGLQLMTAFGPGFSAAFLLLRINGRCRWPA
jgi:alkylresorcinol/alkylpyrone synthase